MTLFEQNILTNGQTKKTTGPIFCGLFKNVRPEREIYDERSGRSKTYKGISSSDVLKGKDFSRKRDPPRVVGDREAPEGHLFGGLNVKSGNDHLPREADLGAVD